jgi:hypothetical protein
VCLPHGPPSSLSGPHSIFVVASPATAAPAVASTTVDVAIDAVEAPIVSITGLDVPRQLYAQLVTKLAVGCRAPLITTSLVWQLTA